MKYTEIRKTLFTSALMMILFLNASVAAFAETPEIYHIRGLTFQIPLKLSPPVKAGLDATSFFFPDKAESGKEKFEMMLVFLDKEMMESAGMNDEELLQYVKTTYLGSAKKAEKKLERKALGKTLQGEWQKTSIPRKATLEIYLIPLKDGSKLSVAFRSYEGMDEKESEKVIKAFFDTLAEK